jgi:tetratricopeptide (TPR) repeat protein
MSEIQHELKHYQESADAMEKAVSLKPGEGILHADLGREYLNLGKDKEAIEEFDKAVEQAPNPLSWNNISYEIAQADSKALMGRAQQYAESAVSQVASELRNATLDRVQLRDLGNVQSLAAYWDTLGWVTFKQGNAEKAIKYIKASWMLDQSGEVADHLGQIYQKQGKKDEALKFFAQAASAQRPPPENAGRVAAAAGIVDDPKKYDAKDSDMKKKFDAVVEKYKPGLLVESTIKLSGLAQKSADADFFVLISQPGKVDAVKFVSGSDALKTTAKATILGINFANAFPDDTPTRLIRRVTVHCNDKGECSMELQVPETITSVD